ncbi:uncharacterized protein LOC105696474 [Orussus abietinus]|uniref:uncharacterized protein LOC105696474 n=1 Tax=Orussus abietinus TaxID=222816 RepID=UPI0006254886|nr:uncharacterized protein LOC105696474 [Orussus abietinus]XP_012274382.1 uncharacterized protein LOC105696474 [Orussus abietinus]XP_012274383.1 uncharacterized protein LOC105696474 [Orussus abietinus]XP_012274384.1 uncharacterized protein LOC105696474 [Orussus abietinus]
MSLSKKSIGGSIHRIREFELEKVNLSEEFDILQIVGEGWFGKILLAEHRSTQTEMVLKALPKAYTGITDFYREFHYGLHLSAHRNIITTYDVAFETAGFYVFSQEYAPLGDLTSNITETGLGELHAKRVARQLAAAVHHIHSRELVHRDIKLDNILVFRSDFSRIKLCDFGETRRVNTVVRRHNEWLPYSPPEVLQVDTDETYKAQTSHDVWQFGIVVFVCLTGCLPWQKAAMDDPRFTRYLTWHTATLNIAKKPKLFQLISSRAQRMFKRLLDPKADKRPASVLEVNKFQEDRWLARLGAEKALNGGADERDELCPSMYSFHSSVEEKNQLLFTLTQYGIETTVDRSKKKDRIREWIQASAIVEENEDETDPEFVEDFHEVDEHEEEELINMKGRHFPERRPSSTARSSKPSNSHSRHRRKSDDRTSKPHQTTATRSIQRKIPFAPQVATERQTVARFTSFPNGDPSLALKTNGANPLEIKNTSVADAGTKFWPHQQVTNVMVENRREKVERQPLGMNGTTGTSGITGTSSSGNSGSTSQDGSTTVARLSPPTGVLVAVPAVPLTDMRQKESSLERSAPRSPQVPVRKHRSQTAPFPNPEGTRTEVPQARRTQSAVTLSTMKPSNESNGIKVMVNTTANPLTMSVASQLVMQSFNSLQAMNVALPAVTQDYQEDTPPVQDEPAIHGKDIYEHYGITTRPDVIRYGSTGSGSRSISN